MSDRERADTWRLEIIQLSELMDRQRDLHRESVKARWENHADPREARSVPFEDADDSDHQQ